jgi:hypothetical protein
MILIVIGCILATWDSMSPLKNEGGGKAPTRRQIFADTVLKGG